ncbi:hypothetical protein BaRGS_00006916 [Batillaria attramentaria]|uniref:Ribosomal protein S10 n=1 Tax=Batillaria attramentaria TaxID=370345 RepID=A0ABD0LQI1_9CAEN
MNIFFTRKPIASHSFNKTPNFKDVRFDKHIENFRVPLFAKSICGIVTVNLSSVRIGVRDVHCKRSANREIVVTRRRLSSYGQKPGTFEINVCSQQAFSLAEEQLRYVLLLIYSRGTSLILSGA